MGTSSSHGDGLPQVYCGGHVKVPVRVNSKRYDISRVKAKLY